MTSTKLQINYNIQKFNDQNSFGYLVIDIWILFTHKIINFKGVPRKNGAGCEITSLSCYLFFEICYLFHKRNIEFIDKLYLVSDPGKTIAYNNRFKL